MPDPIPQKWSNWSIAPSMTEADYLVGIVNGRNRRIPISALGLETVGESTSKANAARNAALDALSDLAGTLPNLYGTESRFAQFDIRDYGAKVDGVELRDVSMIAGSAVVDSTSYTFTSADVGKVIGVEGAGFFSPDYATNANDGKLISTIVSVSDGNATLANAAINTVFGATAAFGTADDNAVAAARDAAVAAGGGTVFFPAGRTIVTKPCPVPDYVSWAGVHRDVSWVEVIFSAPGTGSAAAGTCDWLSCVSQSKADPLTGASFHDFGINARFHIRPGGYTNPMKPLNIYYVKRCDIYRMNVWNTPTTAIPFDHSYEGGSVIAQNLIINPGRMYSQNTNPSKSGCSGIGIGTHNDGFEEPGLVVGNVIIGTGNSSTNPAGNNGIFLEGQSGSDPTKASLGYRIVNNYVQGMENGIADEGSQGTIISGNIVNKCITGIRVTDGGVGGAFPGIDTLVTNNTIINCVAPGSADPISNGQGILISTNASDNVGVRPRIKDNQIIRCAGRGIRLNAGTNDLQGLEIVGNKIRETQRSAIYFAFNSAAPANYVDPIISDNVISQCGLAGVSNDSHAIYVSASLVNPTIQNNRVLDGNGIRIGGLGAMSGVGLISGNKFTTVTLDVSPPPSIRIMNNTGWNTQDTAGFLWVPATQMIDVLGTTTVGVFNGVPYRAFPNAADTTAAVTVQIPSDWSTFTVQVVWTSALSSSGDVRFRGDFKQFTTSTALNGAMTAGTEITANTMADATPQVRNLRTGMSADLPWCTIHLHRHGTYVADTSANPALVLGLRLIRTT